MKKEEKVFSKEIQQIRKDIEDLKIQGATNVAISTFEGMKMFLSNRWGNDNISDLVKSCLEVGEYLSTARINEPLARNGVIYVRIKALDISKEGMSIKKVQDKLLDFIDEYLDMITSSKKTIIKNSTDDLKDFENILTHCHSSTAVDLLKTMAKNKSREDFGVVCTETRPNFQGRITAKSLSEAGIDTTFIADSAAESFAIGRGSRQIDAVFLGCDQFTKDGYMINKIGSWGIAMAAHYAGKPVYIITPLLKIDPYINTSDIEIEIREDRELWKDAPKNLDIFNPAFEIVDKSLITGYVTEEGILEPKELEKVVKQKYAWLFVNNLENS